MKLMNKTSLVFNKSIHVVLFNFIHQFMTVTLSQTLSVLKTEMIGNLKPEFVAISIPSAEFQPLL